VDSSTTRPFGGTGLGLTISREILQAHNGNVWAESEPGKGSTFTFFIPLTPGKAAAEPFLHPASSKPEPPPFRQDVLIIDDDPAILELLENILREEGFEVRTAKDGLDGMNQVFNRPPDLILLDVRMPKIDGFDLCRFIKGSSTTKSIPVIMLTAAGQASEIEMGAKSGAEEYIVKPFEPDDMLAKVKKWTQPETGDS
jgi:CheY-like chemotaxis protein